MRKVLICLTVLFVLSTAAFARRIFWDSKREPEMSLVQGHQLAQEALGKEAANFYCVGASLAITSSKDGDWTYRYASKSGKQKWVIVDFEKKVQVLDSAPIY